MSIAPFESARTRSAMRSADMPGPGKRLGHDVTIRHLTVCARAAVGMAIAPARLAVTALRRVIFVMVSSPSLMKMMQRAVAAADLEFAGGGDGTADECFGLPHRLDQIEAFGEAGRDRG